MRIFVFEISHIMEAGEEEDLEERLQKLNELLLEYSQLSGRSWETNTPFPYEPVKLDPDADSEDEPDIVEEVNGSKTEKAEAVTTNNSATMPKQSTPNAKSQEKKVVKKQDSDDEEDVDLPDTFGSAFKKGMNEKMLAPDKKQGSASSFASMLGFGVGKSIEKTKNVGSAIKNTIETNNNPPKSATSTPTKAGSKTPTKPTTPQNSQPKKTPGEKEKYKENKHYCLFDRTLENVGKRIGTKDEHPNDWKVPDILTDSIKFLSKYGLKEENILKSNGNITKTRELKDNLEQAFYNNKELYPLLMQEKANPHNVAGLLKCWLRELPETLFPWVTYERLMDAMDIKDEEERNHELTEIFKSLPKENRETLKVFLGFLKEVTLYTSQNNMNSETLASVFMASLLADNRTPTWSSMNDRRSKALVKSLIEWGGLEPKAITK